MRTDSIGIFWQDVPRTRGGERVLGPMPPIPETGWTAPREFPNLQRAPIIGLDVETYDPFLLTHGPGWARRKNNTAKRPAGVPDYLHPVGCLVGVSVAAYGRAWYFPLRHTIRPETNLNPDHVLAWLRDALSGPQPKVGTNILYDVGWLAEEGVDVAGPLYDISNAEALLTETGKLNLDTLAQKYLSSHKETNLLYRWCSDWYGGGTTDQRKNIWRSPPCLVGPYAEADALLPLQILERQLGLLEEQGLRHLFDMETRLSRLLLAMRFQGVRVDLERAQQVDDILTARIETAQETLNKVAGVEVDVNKAATIAPAFDAVGINYSLTEKTKKPSFKKDFLKAVEHPIADHIRELRRCLKLRDTFVRAYVMDAHVGGRVFGQFHSLRNDAYGTRSGRFSSSNPNLQNIPSRHPELAPLVRSIFVPEHDAEWLRFDYSQIEYRFLVHFATGRGAEQARQRYHDDPKTDYHAAVQQWLREIAHRELDRKSTKNINFGLVYGMGEPKLARELQLSKTEARKLFEDYHKAVPYARTTMDAVCDLATRQGYIQTILGRRSRFDLWEPIAYGADRAALPLDAALRKYGSQICRASLHKALNRLLQGSAADLLKTAMLRCYEAGLFNGTAIPLLTVHDELDFSAADITAPLWREIQHTLETAIPLRVPVIADRETGPNWGNLKEDTK